MSHRISLYLVNDEPGRPDLIHGYLDGVCPSIATGGPAHHLIRPVNIEVAQHREFLLRCVKLKQALRREPGVHVDSVRLVVDGSDACVVIVQRVVEQRFHDKFKELINRSSLAEPDLFQTVANVAGIDLISSNAVNQTYDNDRARILSSLRITIIANDKFDTPGYRLLSRQLSAVVVVGYARVGDGSSGSGLSREAWRSSIQKKTAVVVIITMKKRTNNTMSSFSRNIDHVYTSSSSSCSGNVSKASFSLLSFIRSTSSGPFARRPDCPRAFFVPDGRYDFRLDDGVEDGNDTEDEKDDDKQDKERYLERVVGQRVADDGHEDTVRQENRDREGPFLSRSDRHQENADVEEGQHEKGHDKSKRCKVGASLKPELDVDVVHALRFPVDEAVVQDLGQIRAGPHHSMTVVRLQHRKLLFRGVKLQQALRSELGVDENRRGLVVNGSDSRVVAVKGFSIDNDPTARSFPLTLNMSRVDIFCYLCLFFRYFFYMYPGVPILAFRSDALVIVDSNRTRVAMAGRHRQQLRAPYDTTDDYDSFPPPKRQQNGIPEYDTRYNSPRVQELPRSRGTSRNPSRLDILEDRIAQQEKNSQAVMDRAFKTKEDVIESLNYTHGTWQEEKHARSMLQEHIRTITAVVNRLNGDISNLEEQIKARDNAAVGTNSAVKNLEVHHVATLTDLRGRVVRCDSSLAKLSQEIRQCFEAVKQIVSLTGSLERTHGESKMKMQHIESDAGQQMAQLDARTRQVIDDLKHSINTFQQHAEVEREKFEGKLLAMMDSQAQVQNQAVEKLDGRLEELQYVMEERMNKLDNMIRAEGERLSEMQQHIENKVITRLDAAIRQQHDEIAKVKRDTRDGFSTVHESISNMKTVMEGKRKLLEDQLRKEISQIRKMVVLV
ncbi:LOW QUALITY PROTEIN: FA81A-like protein [Mya arenaria]|uniref:FA81A-like protein n=1 Tax=Mya arenaria TaxID=6604 RepID=A0ABY7DVV8_MYAAR|nr:LOW QUALITY PROTEIN: FA81A-like protein [Mya arenaria]